MGRVVTESPRVLARCDDFLHQGFDGADNFFVLHLAGNPEVERKVTRTEEHGIDIRRGDDLVSVLNALRSLNLDADKYLLVGTGIIVWTRSNAEPSASSRVRPALANWRVLDRVDNFLSVSSVVDQGNKHAMRACLQVALNVLLFVQTNTNDRSRPGQFGSTDHVLRGFVIYRAVLTIDDDEIETEPTDGLDHRRTGKPDERAKSRLPGVQLFLESILVHFLRLAPACLRVNLNGERKTRWARKRSQKLLLTSKRFLHARKLLKVILRDGTLRGRIICGRTEDEALVDTLRDILPRTAEAVQTGIRMRWNPGAQLCVWHDGGFIVDAAEGYAAHGVPMRPDSINLWFSSGKPVAAVAVALLKQDGLLDFDQPVATYWPDFAQGGKEAITTRHILTHTSGMRTAEVADASASYDEVLRVILAARIERNWEPGKRAGYHPTSGWYVLGELVRRLSGVPYEVFTREQIFAPLGMESSAFIITDHEATRLGERLAVMHLSKNDELAPEPRFSVSATSRFVRPGGGLRSTAQDMVRFYRMLLGYGELDGTKILDPTLAAEITAPQRTGMKDETFGYMMDWGLGVMLDNKIHGPAAPYGFGAHASARTFGHGGRESSIAFGDPENQLAVAVIFNGMPGELRNDRRSRPVLAAIYEDLGLA